MKIYVYKEPGDKHGKVWEIYQLLKNVTGKNSIYIIGSSTYEAIGSEFRGTFGIGVDSEEDNEKNRGDKG